MTAVRLLGPHLSRCNSTPRGATAVGGQLPQDAAEPGLGDRYNLLAVPLAAGVLAWAGVTLAPAVGRC
jgi:hypothetical protein